MRFFLLSPRYASEGNRARKTQNLPSQPVSRRTHLAAPAQFMRRHSTPRKAKEKDQRNDHLPPPVPPVVLGRRDRLPLLVSSPRRGRPRPPHRKVLLPPLPLPAAV